MTPIQHIFLLGILCGAVLLVVALSLLIGRIFRRSGLWLLALSLFVGVAPILAALATIEKGVPAQFLWSPGGRPATWVLLALICWLLRSALSAGVPELWRVNRALMALSGLMVAGAAASLAIPPSALPLFVLPIWLGVVGYAFFCGWMQSTPWVFWLAAGQGFIALGWVGAIYLQFTGVVQGDIRSVLLKSVVLALFGGCTYVSLVWRSRIGSENRVRMEDIDRTDPLTGLALPPVLKLRLKNSQARARELGARSVVVGLRVSNLQGIAADAGLDTPEFALVAAANALSSVMQRVDVAARTAKDQFVVLVESVPDKEHPREVATRFISQGLRGVRLRGLTLTVKFQCIVLVPGRDKLSPDEMLARIAREHARWTPRDGDTAVRLIDTSPTFESTDDFNPASR